ncbi:hypothetical protein GCM10023188_47920 [Pontibacter saemangeumensis]|uniref:Uncharacterized protein n=1 Tax=Pontibacter saemangeumensis TaxID=1084525 RepID=A0ABP8M684_9BACT
MRSSRERQAPGQTIAGAAKAMRSGYRFKAEAKRTAEADYAMKEESANHL